MWKGANSPLCCPRLGREKWALWAFFFFHAEFSAHLNWKRPAASLLLSDLPARLPLLEINPNLKVWRDLLKESDGMDEPSVVFSLFVYLRNPKTSYKKDSRLAKSTKNETRPLPMFSPTG